MKNLVFVFFFLNKMELIVYKTLTRALFFRYLPSHLQYTSKPTADKSNIVVDILRAKIWNVYTQMENSITEWVMNTKCVISQTRCRFFNWFKLEYLKI